MLPKERRTAPNTTARLRADIDHGRTGDKVAHNDPAAAPLGTDDEAAGTAASEERIAVARREEVRRGTPVGDSLRAASQRGGRVGFWLIWIAAVAVLGVLLYVVALA